jgi:hypothetical protein
MGSSSEWGDVGQNFLGPFASRKPRQDKRQFQMVDPFQGQGPQRQYTEDILTANLGRGTGGTQNPFVGAGPEQQRAMASMEAYRGQAEPLYGTSVRSLEDTAGGKYLDVAGRPEWQRLSAARQDIARDLFADATTANESRAAARGNYDSSARRAQLNREAGRIDTQAAQDIAQAGWGQYGAERGHMMDASKFGAQLAPGLASQVFGQGEQLRSAEQAGNTAQMEAQLRAAGLDQQKINQWLQWMALQKPEMVPSIVGPSNLDTNLKKLQTEAGAFSNVAGGMKGL